MLTEMLSPVQLSELTQINVRTLVRLAGEGHIPAVKVGRQWRFVRADVERWLKTRATNQKRRILVVDDEQDVLNLLRRILARDGYDVVTALGGPEGIRMLGKDDPFDLVILDLNMPDVDGPGVMEWMKDHDVDVDVMLFTGYPDSELMVRAMNLRHVTLVQKPADGDTIRKAVLAILGGVEAITTAGIVRP